MAQFEVSGIDPVKYGVLLQRVQDYERRFDAMERQMDKMQINLEKLLALANQGSGGLYVGMAIVSAAAVIIGYLISFIDL